MNSQHGQFIQLLFACFICATSATAMASHPGESESPVAPGQGLVIHQLVPSLWATTVSLGDPADPETPLLQGHMLLHPDGTAEWDTTAASGLHPFFPSPRGAPTIYGTWALIEDVIIRIETSNYTAGPDGNGALGRQTFELTLGDDEMQGLIVADGIPCDPVVGLLRCPNPVDVGPVEFGSGAPEVPVTFERIPRP